MKKLLLLILLVSLFSASYGKDLKYPVFTIPDSLKEGADAVVRLDETVFEVHSIGEGTTTYKYAVTILNSKASHYARFVRRYSEGLNDISNISGKAYNALGVEVASLKRSDISDVSDFDGYAGFSSSRLKKADLSQNTYPYTVEFSYETKDNDLLFYPRWYAQGYENESVELATFKVLMPKGMELLYKEMNLSHKVEQTSDRERDIYFWKLEGIKPIKDEPYSLYMPRLPHVLLGASAFSFGGEEGSLKTWKEMGQWQNRLNAGRDEVPEEVWAEVEALTAGISSEREKARKVYEYMQQRTRYVSIQLGVGGWQTFPASYVAENGYGDCKALSNYTGAILRKLGLTAHYTLIKAGNKVTPIYSDFPSSQFNHVILCVPLQDEQDTVWLECTSQTNPFGYLGDFTSDRDALVITENGGELIHTPVYDKEDNLQVRKITGSISKEGVADISVKATYKAMQQDYKHGYLNASESEQKEWLYEHFDIPSFDINSYSLNWEKKEIPAFHIEAEMTIRKLGSANGKRLFIKPNIMTAWKHIPKAVEDRATDVVIDMAFTDRDTVELQLPENFHPEYIPKAQSIESEFGSYTSEVKIEEGKLLYIREMKHNKGQFPASSYQSLIDFYKAIVKADKQKVVLVDKT